MGLHRWVMVAVWATRAEGGVVAGGQTGTAAGVKPRCPCGSSTNPRSDIPIELEDAASHGLQDGPTAAQDHTHIFLKKDNSYQLFL